MPTEICTDFEKIKISSNNNNIVMSNDEYSPEFQKIRYIWQDNDAFNGNNLNGYGALAECSTNLNNYHAISMSSVPLHKSYDFYLCEAANEGFIVGEELEKVKSKSRRSMMQQMSNHISKNFQNLYGKENNNSRPNYIQIGVRLPSKEHVSEIVGKQGIKIKELREKTGALIITPDVSEDHVFIIEAIPHIAINVARLIKQQSSQGSTNHLSASPTQLTLHNRYNHSMTTTPPLTNDVNANSTHNVNMAANRLLQTCGNGGIILRNSNGASINNTNNSMNNINGHIKSIVASGFIEVPKNIVGRIIGTHGSIITTIQKDTGTEIRSPPKEINNNQNGNNRISPTNNGPARFEILVYQSSSNSSNMSLNNFDKESAQKRILNAKQLIAHVAMHQMERIRAEESQFSNYRLIRGPTTTNNNAGLMEKEGGKDKQSSFLDKEQVLTDQMQSIKWMWPDVPRLNDANAEEVVLRILEESKKKSKQRIELHMPHMEFHDPQQQQQQQRYDDQVLNNNNNSNKIGTSSNFMNNKGNNMLVNNVLVFNEDNSCNSNDPNHSPFINHFNKDSSSNMVPNHFNYNTPTNQNYLNDYTPQQTQYFNNYTTAAPINATYYTNVTNGNSSNAYYQQAMATNNTMLVTTPSAIHPKSYADNFKQMNADTTNKMKYNFGAIGDRIKNKNLF